MKFICYQESLIIMAGVLTGFLVEKCAARPESVRKSSFPKKKLVFVLHLAGCVRGFQSRGRGETTCGTEKRCSHNLQSGHPA